MIAIDHTQRTDLTACLRKYELRWLRHITPSRGSTALRYGIAWHGCMEGYYNAISKYGWMDGAKALTEGGKKGQDEFSKANLKQEYMDDYRNVPNLMKSFISYVDHFNFDEGILEILDSERVFKLLIKPTEIEQHFYPGIEPFYYTGRLDTRVRLNGRPWILEHKTTSQSVQMQARRLHRSPQIVGYNYAARAYSKEGEIPDGSLICLHHLSAYKKKDGSFGESKIDFARVPEVFSMTDLANWRLGLVADVYRLQQTIKSGFFAMCHYSCYTYGGCMFTNLCEQNRKVESQVLAGYYVDNDPWTVLSEGELENKLIVIEEEEGLWQEHQQRILNWK